LYQLGIKAWEEKDYFRAYYAFAEVYQKNPSYKQIQKFHSESKKAYIGHKLSQFEEELKTTYLKAFDQQANSQFALAQSNYQKVIQMRGDYKDARQRLGNVNQQLDIINKTRDLEQRNKWVTATYKLGFNHQANGRYAQAKIAYQQVLQYAPRYKDTLKRLNGVKAQLAKQPKAPPIKPNPISLPNTGQTAPFTTQNCYQKGIAFGKCATSSDPSSCSGLDKVPPECKDNPDFKRGLKSVVSSGSQSMLKGLKF